MCWCLHYINDLLSCEVRVGKMLLLHICVMMAKFTILFMFRVVNILNKHISISKIKNTNPNQNNYIELSINRKLQ